MRLAALGVLAGVLLAAWWRMLATPGQFNDGDLSFPLTPLAFLEEHYPLWHPAGSSNLVAAARFFFDVPLLAIAHLAGWDGGAYARLVLAATSLLAALSAYAACHLLHGLLASTPPLVVSTNSAGAATSGRNLLCAVPPRPPRWLVEAAAVLAGLAYALNPWWIARTVYLYLLVGYSVAPLVLALAIRGFSPPLRTRSWAGGAGPSSPLSPTGGEGPGVRGPTVRAAPIAAAALLHAAIGSATPHTMLFVGAAVALAAAYHAAAGFAPGPARWRLRQAVLGLGLFGAVYLPASAFIWLPALGTLVAGGAVAPGYVLIEQNLRAFVQQHDSLLKIVTLSGTTPWQALVRLPAPAATAWLACSLLPPAVLLAGLLWTRGLRRLLGFLALLAAGTILLLVIAATPPFDRLYRTAVVSLPSGWVVREPDKVMLFLALAYALGLGLVLPHAGARWLALLRPLPGAGPLSLALAGLALALALFGQARPGIDSLLWRPETAYLPHVLPPDYRAVAALLARREAWADRVLVPARDAPRVWSSGRADTLFFGRSLAQRSISPHSLLGGAFVRLVEAALAAGDDPRALLQQAGITLIVAEADHPAGAVLRSHLLRLGYPVLYRGEVVTLFAVPGPDGRPLGETAAAAPVQAATRVRLVSGFPPSRLPLSQGERGPGGEVSPLHSVSLDYVVPDAPTLAALQALAVPDPAGLSGQDLALLGAPGRRLVPLLPATLNGDPQAGWARGSTVEEIYTQWRRTLARFGLANWQFDLGLGLLYTAAPSPSTVTLSLPSDLPDGQYTLWARLFQSPAGRAVRLQVREAAPALGRAARADTPDASALLLSATLPAHAPTSAFVWQSTGTLTLRHGRRYVAELTAPGAGLHAVNALALLPAPADPPPQRREQEPGDAGPLPLSPWEQGPEGAVSLPLSPWERGPGGEGLFPSPAGEGPGEGSSSPPPRLSWRRLSPVRYQVTVTGAQGPFLLVLHEHFDPGWAARVGSRTLRPVLADAVSNGFVITPPGPEPFTVTLEYTAQRWYDAGLALSAVTVAAVLALLALGRRRRAVPAGAASLPAPAADAPAVTLPAAWGHPSQPDVAGHAPATGRPAALPASGCRRALAWGVLSIQALATSVLVLTQGSFLVAEAGWRAVPAAGPWQVTASTDGAASLSARPVVVTAFPVQPATPYRLVLAVQAGAAATTPAPAPFQTLRELDRAGLPRALAWLPGHAPAVAPWPLTGVHPAPADRGCVTWTAEAITGPDATALLLLLDPDLPLCQLRLERQQFASVLRWLDQAQSPLMLGALAAELAALALLAGLARGTAAR